MHILTIYNVQYAELQITVHMYAHYASYLDPAEAAAQNAWTQYVGTRTSWKAAGKECNRKKKELKTDQKR